MAIADDFSVALNGDIRHTSGTSRYTVLELHRFLQGGADDASMAGDDLISKISKNPSSKKFDTIIELQNSYNLDDTAAQYFYEQEQSLGFPLEHLGRILKRIVVLFEELDNAHYGD